VHFKAGSCVYASAPGRVIAAIDIPDGNDKTQISWQGKVAGNIWTMLAADGKLFVVTA